MWLNHTKARPSALGGLKRETDAAVARGSMNLEAHTPRYSENYPPDSVKHAPAHTDKFHPVRCSFALEVPSTIVCQYVLRCWWHWGRKNFTDESVCLTDIYNFHC